MTAVIAGGLVEAAFDAASNAGSNTSNARLVAVNDDPVNFVIAISVDGLKPSTIRDLGRDGVPALQRMMREGAFTLNARDLTEQTVTLPNHTSMITGRRLDVAAGGHGVDFNSDQGTTVHEHAGAYVSSMFDVAHDRGLRTSMYVSKDKFHTLNRSWDRFNGADDTVGVDHGRDKIDRFFLDTDEDNVTRFVRRLADKPDHVSFVHLGYPDAAGHQYGWDSRQYVRAVQAADAQIARILSVVRDHTRLRRHANVVLTGDHGGKGRGHDAAATAANYTVPFMVWGVGVSQGADLYALNKDTREDPGTTRPRYRAAQPIRNGELANLGLDLLDLPAVSGSLFNKNQDLDVN